MKSTRSYFSYLFVTALAAGAVSCQENFLDTRLDTQPSEETIDETFSSLARFGYAAYSRLQNYNHFEALDGNLFAPVTDEAVQTAGFGSVYWFNNGSWNQFSNPADVYNYYYSGIYAANYFFEYLEKVGDYRQFLAMNRDTITTGERNRYLQDVALMGWMIPEIHILRAYYYFELVKRYGGVPIVTRTYAADESPSVHVSSYEDVIGFIIDEIDAHKNDLQPNWAATNLYGVYAARFSQGSALALKARVLLHAASPLNNENNDAAKWQAAAAAANEAVMFAQTTGGNSLANSYRDYFVGQGMLAPGNGLSNETILAVRQGAGNAFEKANYPVGTRGGSSGITPTQNLVDAYEFTAAPVPGNPYAGRDPRLGYSIVTNGSNWNGRMIDQAPGGSDDMTKVNASKTGYYLRKFMPDNLTIAEPGIQEITHNWPLFRYGELLLVYAETMNESYGPDNANGYGMTAREALNNVRARADVNMPPVTVTGKEAFRDALKHERRIELAFEDHRYWDLLRWKDAAAVLSRHVGGVRVTRSGNSFVYTPTTVQSRVFDGSKMYHFPFSQREIVASQGMLAQNPGW